MERLDSPGTACYLESHDCSQAMLGHGGFDQHHPWPKSMGGPDSQSDDALCPNHHRRQHALVRYLVECYQAGIVVNWEVTEHFTSQERSIAQFAVASWISAGMPKIGGWPCPAARLEAT